MTNLVLGLALDYNVDQVKTFIKSFRKYNSKDSIVLFVVSQTSNEFDIFLTSNDVKTEVYETFRHTDTRMNNARFIRYLEFLLNRPEYQSSKILITDVRDIVFQSDPFENLPDDFLYLFKEDRGITIGQCEYNSYWMGCAYNDEINKTLKNNTIICAGTIFGTATNLINLIKRIQQELLDLRQRNFYNYQHVNVDQAILNKLAYLDLSDQIELKENGDIIGTVGVSVTVAGAQDIVTVQDEFILINGIKPAVVHQYDRHQALVDFVENLY